MITALPGTCVKQQRGLSVESQGDALCVLFSKARPQIHIWSEILMKQEIKEDQILGGGDHNTENMWLAVTLVLRDLVEASHSRIWDWKGLLGKTQRLQGGPSQG